MLFNCTKNKIATNKIMKIGPHIGALSTSFIKQFYKPE